MKPFANAMLAALLALGTPVAAGENLVVVELFTSQGCSSCPPADGIFGEIAQRDDVLALALHVDYWDYIGWKDEFADPAFTARQKAYAYAHAKSSIYTPQMIVGGQDVLVGLKPMTLADLIQDHGAKPAQVDLTARRDGNRIDVEVTDAARHVPMLIELVTYIPKRTVSITRGENAGRTLDYHNIVATWTRLGEWSGEGTFRATVTVDSDNSVAVLVQEKGPGAIVAAARAP